MAPLNTAEDEPQVSDEGWVENPQKGTIPSQPDQSTVTPQGRIIRTLPDRSYSAPKSFNSAVLPLNVPDSNSTPMTVPARSRKRDSNGKIKQMVAELNTRADLAISREKAITPEGWRVGHAAPFSGPYGNVWGSDVFRRSSSTMGQTPRSPKTPGSTNAPTMGPNSRDVKEEQGEEGHTGQRKRQGSLLEWRNKEMFEEPVRI